MAYFKYSDPLFDIEEEEDQYVKSNNELMDGMKMSTNNNDFKIPTEGSVIDSLSTPDQRQEPTSIIAEQRGSSNDLDSNLLNSLQLLREKVVARLEMIEKDEIMIKK